MTDRTSTRQKAAEALRLQGDESLQAILSEIEDEAKALFLASGGDPAALTAAFRKVEAVQTFRQALQARVDAQTWLDKQEAKRGPHGQQ